MSIDDFVKTGRAVLSKAKELERLLAAANGRIRELERALERRRLEGSTMAEDLCAAKERLLDEREVSDKLEKALEEMVSEKCDYMIRNKLGNPEVEHSTKTARSALAEVRAIRKGEKS